MYLIVRFPVFVERTILGVAYGDTEATFFGTASVGERYHDVVRVGGAGSDFRCSA